MSKQLLSVNNSQWTHPPSPSPTCLVNVDLPSKTQGKDYLNLKITWKIKGRWENRRSCTNVDNSQMNAKSSLKVRRWKEMITRKKLSSKWVIRIISQNCILTYYCCCIEAPGKASTKFTLRCKAVEQKNGVVSSWLS